MPQTISTELFTGNLQALLKETFEKVDGIYLDGGTSLSETLTGITAEQASRPTVEGGATIAGHVEHLRFYIRILRDYIDGKWHEKVDWNQSWLCHAVSQAEWDTIRSGLMDDYQRLKAHLSGIADWNDDHRLGGAMAIVIHTAYHLGAIRQMMKVVKG